MPIVAFSQHVSTTPRAVQRQQAPLDPEALQDYARLAQLCRDAGKEQAAKQLESEAGRKM